MANKQFDVVVIGAGPGGYIAAIRAAQLGFSAACIESESYADPKGDVRLGGTCLNVGCIPSKALLRSSELFHEANHAFVMHGITAENVKMDVGTMVRRKDNIVTQLTSGIKGLFKKNKVTLLAGHGSFAGREDDLWQLAVTGKDGNTEIVDARHVIVATGSSPRHLDGIPVDNKVICDNVGALSLDAVPKRLGVIGAGVIGLELGSVWKRLGSEVTILEALPDFLAAADPAVAKEAWKTFTQKQGLNIHLGVKITNVKQGKKGVTIDYEMGDGVFKLECDKLIVSVGRVPNTAGLGCDNVGLKLDDRGRVEVNEPLPDQPRKCLGGRRRDPRPDARAQGHGRGRDGRRTDRRAGRPRQLRRHSLGDLHQPGNRLGRQDRDAAQERGLRITRSGRFPSSPTAARWGRATPPASSRCWPAPRPTASSACISSA